MSVSCSWEEGYVAVKEIGCIRLKKTLGVVSWENHFLSFTVRKVSAEDLKKEMELPEIRLGITGLWSPASLLVSSQRCLTCKFPR